MNSKGGGNNGKGSNGISGIPAASRKMVQSLKEIVHNFPEHEIYAMLKECNMDPNEAVSRLLSQDPFHEVKSKREKKKENKDTTDTRSRGSNNTSSRGGRPGADRYGGRGGTNQFSSTDSGFLQGKPLHKKENGTHVFGGSTSFASGMGGNNVNWRPPSHSDSVATENNKLCGIGMSDVQPSVSHHGGLQSAWMGVPGQVSMADIVKMGRPQAKSSTPNSSIHSGNHQKNLVPSAASHHHLHSLQGHAPKVSETNSDQGFALSHNATQNDEWPLIDHHPAVNVSSVADGHANSNLYANPSNLDEANWQQTSHLDEHVDEDGSVENADNFEPASVPAKGISDDNAGGASAFDANLYKDTNSYQPHSHPLDNDQAEDGVSSVTANLEELNLQKDDQGSESEEDKPSVVIPNHLQPHNPECLNLSFGSFGSGTNAATSGSGPFASRPLKSELEETSAATDVSTIEPSDARYVASVMVYRNPDYYGDEHLTASDGNLVHRTDVGAETYDSPSISQPEVLNPAPSETAQGNQYSFPSSSQGFTYENTQQLDTTFSHSQTSSQMQNLAPFSSVMAYTNSLPSALLASTVQTSREDIPYSPFPATQSMPAKYSNIASSIGAPTLSMTEALRASNISTPQPNPQTLPGAGVATGPALPQHLAVHPYSQPTLPLGHFANMISYPFLPQSYTYMPSAFQQGFAGNSTYHQSLAAVLPQYKNSVSVSSLPQSAAIASAYGFGSSTSIPGGNFPLNPPAAPTATTIGYDDIVNSQYKDNNHMISLQQNENSAMWVHGPGSRTMSAVPASTYYSFQGQNQQSSGFRQGQQPSQHFGALGYPNFYHSQTGISLEQQQQNLREASLSGGSQGQQPSKQSQQQLWQNGY
ncbi:GBF-interacting protein 1-like isoform X1 [Senna tora]|uniref:GBF-interacting protein 1-like isoform X1 n=1 Tax=Senna tora TaxID=362788 RepID=A0A834SGL8_9FABA|nr:GBF-interacting protein 1-like isoform X1 [Senna tora]